MRVRFMKVWVRFRWRSQRKWNYRIAGAISVLRAVAMVKFTGYKLYNKTCGLDGLSNSRLSSEFWKLISLLFTRTLTSYWRFTPGTTQH